MRKRVYKIQKGNGACKEERRNVPMRMEEIAEVSTGEPMGKGVPVSRSRIRRMTCKRK